MKKFEYKTYAFDTINASKTINDSVNFNTESLEPILNQFGNEGWELVSSTRSHSTSGQTVKILLIFKREK
ncbi:Uncharacterised protein [Candidatus Ornithobacterium hominis]|uniref:DUF4177 domain-containing protein n=1 Tax=Candidatus Ornithobacterium hominis TaxID=2497989 RepID=A0A383U2Z1_9FLAO|nr:DUF4177 domain-containing protein [Candidatus Ornithobacterium hominis]MCT7905205.1 DUF4177 domain-containing protein [Candidatus Ornithobacterium hominis]SZD74292.1 Uncharacterised protein [Candidatus Ornithobacterium hominis]